MSGPRQYEKKPGARRMLAIGLLGLSVIAAMAAYRTFRNSDAEAAYAAARIRDANALDDLRATQQQLVDELQMTRDRVARQQAEIRRLTLDFEDVSQKLDALRNAFASEPAPRR